MNKKILRLAIPNIISNITVPLLSLVDLALMGHLDSDIYIGAISLGGVLFNFIYWAFNFLRMGTSGLTGQAYGAGDKWKVNHLFYQSLLVSLIIALSLILLQSPIEWMSFGILEGSDAVKESAKVYFRIRIWAAPATLGLYALNGWLVGMKNAKIPMMVAILVNIVNILLNSFFVLVLKMTSDGVALATVISQFVGFTVTGVMIYRAFPDRISWHNLRYYLNVDDLKKFFTLNRDIFIRTLCIILVFTFFTSKSAGVDNQILAANTLLLQFMMFFSFFMDGFAYAGESLSANYYGARDKSSFRNLLKLLFVWGVGLAGLFTVVYAFAGETILRLLTNNREVIEVANQYMWWVILVPILSFPAYIWDAIYIGVTSSKGMRNTMILATLVLFFPMWFIFKPYLGNHALWLAMVAFMFGRGFFQTVLAKKEIFRKIDAI
ncbi:MATE family efflux transporter [Halosquirtibacter xylanolyticus]|uniref:MATE family efflux transporter n=1 Tax=Halosquirtibacter xylanolyticus TaxID=3374599 RepID=UPI003748AA90|nr:MATE family efflux transporter [Prolixibacteraceae bacterium]